VLFNSNCQFFLHFLRYFYFAARRALPLVQIARAKQNAAEKPPLNGGGDTPWQSYAALRFKICEVICALRGSNAGEPVGSAMLQGKAGR
jgi:hypothetical protein